MWGIKWVSRFLERNKIDRYRNIEKKILKINTIESINALHEGREMVYDVEYLEYLEYYNK